MQKLYEKECVVCGTLFTAKRDTAKYCEKHKRNGARTLAKMEAKQRHEQYEYDSHKLITFNCDYCGREHTVERYLLSKLTISAGSTTNWDEQVHHYCCVQHKERDRQDHQYCDNCGKSLKDCTYPYSIYTKYNYCSADCEASHKQKLSLSEGKTFICQHCGNTFRRQYADVAYFCSQECSKAAKKAGWKSPKTIAKEEAEAKQIVHVKLKCNQCNKIFTETYKNEIDAYIDQRNYHFCSKDCRSTFYNALREQRKKEEAKQKADKVTLSPGESLCATCKVSYRDCERMRSNFRIIPKGAHYSNKGILVECPKYRV